MASRVCDEIIYPYPKLQRCDRWSLGMDKWFHPILYNGWSFISILEWSLVAVTKDDSDHFDTAWSANIKKQPLLTEKGEHWWFITYFCMMTSSNGTIFRVTGHLCGESPVPGEFPAQRPVTRSFDVFYDLRLNKRLSKQLWGWWFETPSRQLWRHCNGKIGYIQVEKANT